MNYHDYKLIHLFSIMALILFSSAMSFTLNKKVYTILTTFFLITTTLSGLQLMQRFGLLSVQALPHWVLYKIGILIGLCLVFVFVKFKFKHLLPKMIWPLLLCLFIIALFSVYKPL